MTDRPEAPRGPRVLKVMGSDQRRNVKVSISFPYSFRARTFDSGDASASGMVRASDGSHARGRVESFPEALDHPRRGLEFDDKVERQLEDITRIGRSAPDLRSDRLGETGRSSGTRMPSAPYPRRDSGPGVSPECGGGSALDGVTNRLICPGRRGGDGTDDGHSTSPPHRQNRSRP